MIIAAKKPFYRGVLLLIGFAIVFIIFMQPLFTVDGEKLTGLQYSDQVFNELSKGSSDFLYMAENASQAMKNHVIHVAFSQADNSLEKLQARLLKNANAQEMQITDHKMAFTVNLGTLLAQATSDARLLFFNEEDRLFAKYAGINPLEIAKAWWLLLSLIERQLQIHNQQPESAAINTVIRRAIEPGNNYFGIPGMKISENIGLISAFLLFYILYTVWYGFAVYEIFAGLGLMTSRAEEEICEE